MLREIRSRIEPLLPGIAVVCALLLNVPGAAGATQFILKASDALNSSSFNAIGNWVTNGTLNPATTPPSPGCVYNTGPYTLRTPTGWASTIFSGESLTLSPGAPATTGSLLLKGSSGATVVIDDLILSGGVLAQGVNSGASGIEWVAGNINVVSNSYVSGLGQSGRFIGISANLQGTASLSNDCNVIYTGNNTGYAGQMSVGGGGAIQINDQANLGGNPPIFNPAQLLLDNGWLVANNTLTLQNANSGITLGSGGGTFTNVSGTSLTISNAIAGAGALTFSGSGELILAGASTYAGTTIINGGRLSFLGSKSGTGNIAVADGATLAITEGGAQMTPAALTLGTTAGVTLELNNVTNPVVAPLAAGSLSSGGTVAIYVRGGPFVAGQSYPLLQWTAGAAPRVSLAALIGANGTLSTNGNSIQLNVASTNQGPVASVKIEAESGALGSDFALSNSTAPTYITSTSDGSGYSPGTAARIATYTVAFPAAGTYELYARVRVGSGTFSDDSMFYGSGFGAKNPTNDADWVLVNGLANVGFTASTEVVTGGGTAGAGVWKWINLSQFAPGPVFTVTSSSLVQSFQIGARENGLDLDTLVFGLRGMTFTVANLNAGVDGTPPSAGIATVNYSDLRQRIDGFGAGAVFLVPGSLDPITDANMDTLFGTNTGQLSLSLLRLRIDPATNWANALLDGQKAVARGAKVFASPWTPPASMKDNRSLVGGSLLPEQYGNYANYLNYFAGFMKSNGVPLAAVSVQNEPDIVVDYECCSWTSNDLQTFFHNNAAAITNAPVMMPESFYFGQILSDLTLNDPVAAANVAIVGGHLYGASISDYPNAHSKGKPTWMTEYLVNDQTIGSALATAEQVHDCLTLANMSAYVWWKTLGDANGLVNASGIPQKRGFAMAQFSRFVRPGSYRIGVSNNDGLRISAYRQPDSTRFAIVAINSTSFPLSPAIHFQNFPAIASVTPWLTSAGASLAFQPAVPVTNAAFVYALPPQSVVTFVGYANSPPAFRSITSSGGQLTLTITGPTGPDYTLLTSTNLQAWEPLFTTNSPALPLILTLTNQNDSARFYRLQTSPGQAPRPATVRAEAAPGKTR